MLRLSSAARGCSNAHIGVTHENVKIAMQTFTDEKGAELMAFADRVLNELPDVMPVGKKAT